MRWFILWKFQAAYEYSAISLHDCRITSITKNGDDIELHFEDGFWLCQENPQNPYKKTLRTGASCLTLLEAACEESIFQGIKFSWDEFCANINSRQWNFECITECYSSNRLVYAGWIWVGNRFYQPNPDFQLWFTFQGLRYNWNTIREDRSW